LLVVTSAGTRRLPLRRQGAGDTRQHHVLRFRGLSRAAEGRAQLSGWIVRYLIVLTAFLLTACALPGVFGSVTATQPTQESCTSRGLMLDAASKQCVASKEAETTGSLPSQAISAPPSAQQGPPQPKAQQPRPQQSQPQQAQPQLPAQPQQQAQSQRSALSVPIEQDAALRPHTPQSSETAIEFAHFVRASGYRCDSISALAPRPGAFTLACNRSTFRYTIKSKGGGWIVTIE